ncbi:hypothetical protein [Neobacillus sp. FSL H8-0543]|uniref:hypothetical protein n=1 Tax=Neobacillus sp. FSL H8-0543 TaxID=2954672 RepID=UPI0031595DE0
MSGSLKGLLSFENDTLKLIFEVEKEDEEILFNWIKEIGIYRLHYYFEEKAGNPLVH